MRNALRSIRARRSAVLIAAHTPLTESMVQAMGRDHAAASREGNGNLGPVTGQKVTEPGAREDESEAARDQHKNGPASMAPITGEQSDRSEQRDEHSHGAMGVFLRGQEVGRDRGE